MTGHDWGHWSQALAWTLIHFLWQGLAIAVVLEGWLALARPSSASQRYLARCVALVALLIAPALTLVHFLGRPLGEDASAAGESAGALLPFPVQLPGPAPTWIVIAWGAGATWLLVRLAIDWLHVEGLRSVGSPLSPEWQARFERLARELGVRARARVVQGAGVAAPVAFGFLRPVVLLPARLFSGLSADQIEALIAHELAHVARHDYLVNLVQSVAEALLFYHPAVWWISRGLRVEREFCCDDRAVAVTQDGLSYARALTALEEWRGGQALQLGVSTLGGSLMHRIQRLVGAAPDRRPGPRPLHAAATFLVLTSMGASAFGLARATAPASAHECRCRCHEAEAPVPAPDESFARRWRAGAEAAPRVERGDSFRVRFERPESTPEPDVRFEERQFARRDRERAARSSRLRARSRYFAPPDSSADGRFPVKREARRERRFGPLPGELRRNDPQPFPESAEELRTRGRRRAEKRAPAVEGFPGREPQREWLDRARSSRELAPQAWPDSFVEERLR